MCGSSKLRKTQSGPSRSFEFGVFFGVCVGERERISWGGLSEEVFVELSLEGVQDFSRGG